jgi:hypothetical protein
MAASAPENALERAIVRWAILLGDEIQAMAGQVATTRGAQAGAVVGLELGLTVAMSHPLVAADIIAALGAPVFDHPEIVVARRSLAADGATLIKAAR